MKDDYRRMRKIARQQLLIAGVLAGLSALSAWGGYFVMFSGFLPLDDEGYLMISRKYFMRGYALYDNVYTQYGPAYYFLRAFVYPIVGESHDRGRLFSLAVWILIALLIALYTYRVTHSVILAALAQLLSFRLLSVIANEPGHPQELCGLILALSLIVSLNEEMWPLLGILAGILLLIKINVGVLFLISIGVLLPGRLRYVSLLAAALLPVTLMRHHLTAAHELQYAFVATTSLIALSIEVLRRNDLPQVSLRDLSLGLCALAITVIGICGATLLLGTSLKGLSYGVFLQNIAFADKFEAPLTFRAGVIPAALIAFVLAVVLRRSSKLTAFLKIAFCIVVAFLAIKGRGIDLFGMGRGDLLILFAAPYLWLGMISGGFKRIFACSVASLQILQAYPIAGSQVAFGSFLFVPVALCGVTESLKELLPNGVWAWPKCRTVLFLALTASLCLGWGFASKKAYASHAPLNFPGAKMIRVPIHQAEMYTILVERLTTSCDGFITWPGINSLYFWTKKEPPTHLNTTEWSLLLNEEQQREVVRQFVGYPRACVVIRSDEKLENEKRFPLVTYIVSNFHEVERIGNYIFMMRN